MDSRGQLLIQTYAKEIRGAACLESKLAVHVWKNKPLLRWDGFLTNPQIRIFAEDIK